MGDRFCTGTGKRRGNTGRSPGTGGLRCGRARARRRAQPDQEGVDEQAGDPDGGDADQDDRGVVVVGGVLDHAADAGQAVDEFGGDQRGVRHAHGQPDAGEGLRKGGGQHDVLDDLPAGGAQRPGRLDQVAGRGRDGRRGGDGDGREGGDGEQRDLRLLVDTEPDDQEREVGQRRQGAQEGDPRLEERTHPPDRAHDEAEEDTQHDAHARAEGDAAQADPEVFDQVGAVVAAYAVPGGGDGEEGVPHLGGRRHQRLAPGARGGHRLPQGEEEQERAEGQREPPERGRTPPPGRSGGGSGCGARFGQEFRRGGGWGHEGPPGSEERRTGRAGRQPYGKRDRRPATGRAAGVSQGAVHGETARGVTGRCGTPGAGRG